MTYKTHINFINSITIPISSTIYILNIFPTINYNFLIIFFGILGAIFPDIDNKKAFISRFIIINYISKIISLGKHRGITHSFYIIIIFSLFFYFYSSNNNFNLVSLTISLSFLLGLISHIFLDSLTYMGIPNFIFNYHLKINFFKKNIIVGSNYENQLNKVLFKIVVVEIFLLFLLRILIYY
jgi:membrane-bound metal-dependent hydrolase YbcI (DUF457 family)